MKSEKEKIPDTKNWQPRKTSKDTLSDSFFKNCLAMERVIILKAELEGQANIDNFDSGLGLEDIIREEFRKILPKRYSVLCGVINDDFGHTAGDFDFILFNDMWFPKLKSGATQQSRRIHLPVDGVYAIGEIKQTLDLKSLDESMKKLVICNRLNRKRTYAFRTIENRESSSCIHGLSNPLYSFILATQLKKGIELDEIVERFFYINKSLKRLEMVRALCVLGEGTVTWSFLSKKFNQVEPALFMFEDLYEPIFPSYFKVSDKLKSSLYPLVVDLSLHLFHSVLAPEDIAAIYGQQNLDIKVPVSTEHNIAPDKEWLEILNTVCEEKHDF